MSAATGGTATVDTGADELDMVRDTAARIAERCAATQSGDGADHAACWQALREAGLTELRTAGDDGRPLASIAMTAAVVEQLARSVCGSPLVGHLLASELLRLAGAESVPDGTLTVLVDEDWLDLAATPSGVAWDAALAGYAVAATADGVELIVLTGATDTIDPTRPLRAVDGDVEVVADEIDGRVRDRFACVARVLLTADLLGAAAAVLDDAVRYVQERVQFGVAVGSFQAVQHVCAQAYVQLEAIRSSLLFAVRALDAVDVEDATATTTSLVAKAFAGDAAVEVTEAAVQVFGGIAITWEHRAHRHLRRVLLDRQAFGDPDTLNERLLDCVET